MSPLRKYTQFADLSPEEYRLAVLRMRYEMNKRSLRYYHEHKVPSGRPRGRPRKERTEPKTPPPPPPPSGKPRGRPRKVFVAEMV
jgi:hypothetical protein